MTDPQISVALGDPVAYSVGLMYASGLVPSAHSVQLLRSTAPTAANLLAQVYPVFLGPG